MKNLLFLIAICLSSVLFAQNKSNSVSLDYTYELNKEYIFKSGNVEMKVFLDEKGNATISRKEIKESATNSSFIFYEKSEDIITYPNENKIALKDEKLGEKYWIIPFEPKSEVIHMRQHSSIIVNCNCKFGEKGGECTLEYRYSSGNLILTCYSPQGCGKCETQITHVNNIRNYLMIKAESVSIAEK